ncbi:MAG: hypothetical protein R2705_20185 [Ilumatobacteraceae bacterium]
MGVRGSGGCSPSSAPRSRRSGTTRRWSRWSIGYSPRAEEFAAWWPRHDVAAFEEHERIFHHLTAGTLRFRTEQLRPVGEPDLRVVVHLPLDGDESTARLAAAP